MKLVVVTTSKMNRDYIQWQYFYDYQLSVHKTGSSRSEVDLSRPVRSLLYLVANKNISQWKWLYVYTQFIEIFCGYSSIFLKPEYSFSLAIQ